jgi:iron(III) transport system permease protein
MQDRSRSSAKALIGGTRLWAVVALVGYALLPWYFVDAGSALTAYGSWPPGDGASALALGVAGHHWWLLPPTLGLLVILAAVACADGERLDRMGRGLVAGALMALVAIAAEAFAIDHRGYTLSLLAEIAGTPGPKQMGLGWGGLVTLLALAMLGARGLAALGWGKGDGFTVSAITFVVALIGLFVFFPVAVVLKQAFVAEDGRLAVGAFVSGLFDGSIWGVGCIGGGVACGVAWNTLVLAIVVGAGSTIIGLAFALVATRTGFRFKALLRLMSVLPIITPPFVIGLAIILILGRTGAVSTLLSDWFGIPRSRWIYGFWGILISQLLAFAPIAFLVLIGVLQAVSPTLEEAAQTLRASRWTTFRTVTLPLIRPGLANAFLLGFIESMADFGNPLVLGGNYEVLSTKIFFAVVGSSHDPARAAILAIVLLVFTLGAFWVQYKWLGDRSYTTVTGKGDAGIAQDLPRRVKWAAYAVAVPWALFTFAIYILIGIGGFVESLGRDYTPTLKHLLTGFRIEQTPTGLFFSGSAWNSLGTTLEVATVAAPLTAGIGLLTAYLLARQRFTGQRVFEFSTMLSFAIPGTVIGVAYILAFNVPPIEITGTGLILIVCFVFRNMPVGVRSGLATLAQIDKSLDEAAITLGARSWTTVRTIVLPLLRPAVIASLVYAFVRAVTAMSAVIFLVTGKYDMATTYIVGRVEVGEYGLAIVYSFVLILVMLAAILLIQFLVGERRLGRRPLPVPAA